MSIYNSNWDATIMATFQFILHNLFAEQCWGVGWSKYKYCAPVFLGERSYDKLSPGQPNKCLENCICPLIMFSLTLWCGSDNVYWYNLLKSRWPSLVNSHLFYTDFFLKSQVSSSHALTSFPCFSLYQTSSKQDNNFNYLRWCRFRFIFTKKHCNLTILS